MFPFLLPLFARLGVPERFQRIAGWIMALALAGLLLTLLLTVRSCRSGQAAKVQADLTGRQDAGKIASGADAVDTTGAVATNTADIHALAQEGQDDIDTAPAGNSNDAADRAACRMRSYRHSGKCIALLGPAAR